MNKEVIKLSRQEVCDLMDIKFKSLQSIELRNGLERRLNLTGFRLINKIKEGRNSYYIVKRISISDKDIQLKEFCNYYKIKDTDEFVLYIKEMLTCLYDGNNMMSKNEFKNKLDETFYIIKKYCWALEDSDVLIKNGYSYYKTYDDERIEVDESEYIQCYFRGKGMRKIFRDEEICSNKELMDNIITLTRSEFNQYIVPHVKKDKCEMCGYTEDLIVHHNYPFMNQLNDTFDSLGLKSKIELSEVEIKNIKIHMLGSQMKFKNTTLCRKCHIEKHNEYECLEKVYIYKKVQNYKKGDNFDNFIKMIKRDTCFNN